MVYYILHKYNTEIKKIVTTHTWDHHVLKLIPDALHSSSNLRMLCSGALADGRINLLGGRDFVLGT